MNNLNPTEKKLFDQLKQIKGHSVWHVIIHNTLMTGCTGTLRNMFLELKTEGEMVPDAMKNIIGAEAYALLSSLSTVS